VAPAWRVCAPHTCTARLPTATYRVGALPLLSRTPADRAEYHGVLGVTLLMALVFPFAVMACANASGSSSIDWRAVFVPLYIVPFPALALSVAGRVRTPRRPQADYFVRPTSPHQHRRRSGASPG
jgi:hypothetical protein